MPLNSTGGQSNFTSWNGSAGTAYVNSAQYYSSPYGLRFYFSGMSDGTDRWATAYFILGGGADGWQEMPRSLSAYSRLTFWAKGESSAAKGIKIELTNSSATFYNYMKSGITTTWAKKTINFTDIRNADVDGVPSGTAIDASSIKKLSFVESYWTTVFGNASTDAIDIDDIQFESSSYAVDSTAPSAPTAVTSSTNGNIVTLTVTATSRTGDSSMENVRVEYYYSGLWRTAGYDYNTADTAYIIKWDVSGLPAATYTIRAIAMDAAGNMSANFGSSYTKS